MSTSLSSITGLPLLLARGALASLAGLAFGGARDLYKVFGYDRNPQHRDFVSKYIHQDITQRLINAPVDGTWTDHPMISGGSAFNTAWADLVMEKDVFYHLGKLDTFVGLGSYAVLLIGIDDGRPLDTPVRMRTDTPNKVLYFQPYLEGSIQVETFDMDPTSPRFNQPVIYKITPGGILGRVGIQDARTFGRASFRVHYTRLLHVADNTLENPIFGHSRLESIYNLLDDLLKISGGSAETYWLAANRGMQADVDKEMELSPQDAENLTAEIEEYQHQLRRFIRTRGVKISNLGSDMADPRGVFSVLLALISANTGIPQRVLMGAEAGQLASQQDRAAWATVLEQRRSKFAEPVMLKPFVRTMVGLNVLPEPAKLVVDWPEPFKMNPLERAQTSAQQARSFTNVARGLETAQKVGIDLASVEESRQIIAPGDKVLIMTEKPKGTMIPKLSAPYNEPQNKGIGAPTVDSNQTEEEVPPNGTAPNRAPNN